ncbi:hypothetical protein EW145_g877 [Phellinidium pouzarii]|uniref:Elongator complex protein 5 n=1 Tax=Phellinidium pouzarii TaxID=167371 RepID=A0A4S4LIJ1_9AGAM|nr:hypothetical protein EW145_g877 [Phellinidium pouzarii]
MSLPLVFFIDWRQRPAFDEQTVETLKRPDIVDIENYYTRSPSSGLWIFEFERKFVGLIAVDASADSLSTQTFSAPAEENIRKPKGKEKKGNKNVASTATIRHFYIAESYRQASAQNDLLTFALKHAFEGSSTVEKIKATPSPFATYLGHALKDAGFVVVDRGPKVGFVASRYTLTYELTREKWVEMQKSSAAQSALPILRGIVDTRLDQELVLVCALYASAGLLNRKSPNAIPCVLDWTSEVRGFHDMPIDWRKRTAAIESAVKKSAKPVTVVIDSVDTLEEDLESPAETYKFLSQILASIRSRNDTSQLVCHLTSLSAVLPLLKQPSFSSSLLHLTAHPPVLLTHIATAYLAPPPSSTSDSFAPENLRFWRVFIPLAERIRDVESLVFGTNGEGGAGGSSLDELVVEVQDDGGVERVLEGWCTTKGGSIALEDLDSLKSVWRKHVVEHSAPDPTKNLTFNLNLTESQHTSRSQVPLPYEHDGGQKAQILYDPDSADDIDDEDPDEDLDI